MKQKLYAYFAYVSCLVFFLAQANFVHAQSGYTCNSCTANDVSITNIELVSTTINPAYNSVTNPGVNKYLPLATTCTNGTPVQAYVMITLDQNATKRYGMDVEGDLYVNGVFSSSFASCDGSEFEKGTRDKFYLDASAITWTCGSKIQLKNVFIGWGNSASDNICSNRCSIGPHCNKDVKDIVFTVITPLSASFTYSGNCNANNTAQTISFDAGTTSGGVTPYASYEWDFDNDGKFDDGTGQTPSFTFSAAGNFTVGLKVTDGANPGTSSTTTQQVSVNPCCIASTDPTGASAATPTICIGSNTDISVTGGSLGTGANWKWYTGGCGTANGGTLVGTGTSINVSPSSTTTYYVRAEGDCGNTNCVTVTVTVSPNPSAGTITGTPSTICIGGTTTYSSNGTPGGSWSSSNEGVATVSGTGVITAVGAGTATITYTVTGCNGPYTATKLVTVSPNSICTVYNGDYFKNTGSSDMGGYANVTLVYTISANNAADCKDLSGLSAASFTITSDAPGNVTYTGSPKISYNGSTKTVTIPAKISVPSNAYSISVTFTLGTTGNYEISGTCSENPVITVSANSEGFVTGGGFIIPTNAGGRLATLVNNSNPVNGYKNNFGFNIKTNKAGKLQGNWNTVIRRKEGNNVVAYQVKSNVAGTLNITQVPGTSKYRADMTFTSANFKNLSCDVCGVDANNGTVIVTVYDNGEPGAGIDKILITIKDKNNNIWYTSDAAASHSLNFTNIQLLNQGNIQVHTLGAKVMTTQSITSANIVEVAPVRVFGVKAIPNPSVNSFNLQIQSDKTKEKMQVRVMDITGRVVQTLQNLTPNQTIQLGSEYKPGMYIIQLIQGTKKQQIKLVKQ